MTTKEFWKDGVLISIETIIPTKEDKILSAKRELEATDIVAIRCVKAGVPFPSEWKNYSDTLRSIVSGSEVEVPVKPEYPGGT